MTAISLWVHAHTDNSWRVERSDRGVHLAAWCMALGLSAALSPVLKRWTGAGLWAWYLGFTLATMTMTLTAVGDLFSYQPSGLYPMGLLLLAGAAVLLTQPRFFDVFALSVAALALNVLLDFGLGHALFSGYSRDWLGSMFMLGISAAGLLAGSVAIVRSCARRHGSAPEVKA